MKEFLLANCTTCMAFALQFAKTRWLSFSNRNSGRCQTLGFVEHLYSSTGRHATCRDNLSTLSRTAQRQRCPRAQKNMMLMKTTEQESIIQHGKITPEQNRQGLVANHSEPQTFQDESRNFREDILQLSTASFRIEGWDHSGLNE
jgi:hypothetical protein